MVFPFVVYGKNRSNDVLEWHKKVYDRLGIAMNYFEFDFPYISHGNAIDQVIHSLINGGNCPDYFIISEIDSIPLRFDTFGDLYKKVEDKQTIAGGFHQSNHLTKADGTCNRPYISPSMHMISTKLYNDLGRPSYDHGGDCDCAELVTKVAQEKGYCIAGIWPRAVDQPMYDLGNGLKFGFGTTYGNYYYHQMNSSQDGHVENFIAKCKEVIQNN